MTRHLFTFTAFFLLTGCGYFMSGSWDDDPDNWERAFNSNKPDDVIMVHSRFTRFPHWSYEFVYYFEIERNDKLTKQLFEENNLILLSDMEAADSKNNLGSESPEWFLPLKIDNYEVWKYGEYPESSFRVFIDKVSGTIYLTDKQL